MLTGMRLMEVELRQYLYFCSSKASKELCQGGEVCDAHGNAAGGVGAYVSIRPHTRAYVSLREHTSAYVCIRQLTSGVGACVFIRQHTSSYVSIREDA